MKQYLELCQKVLTEGHFKEDRTGTGTYSLFGAQMRFPLSEGFPLLTTKKVYLKAIIHELLWFIKGDTNIQYSVKNGVRIWNEWPYEAYKKSSDYQGETMDEFVEKIKNDDLFAKLYGDLGPVYGAQWRAFGIGEYHVDQLQKVIDEIKQNPSSRRLIVCAWNPLVIDQMALPPCHSLFQFYVSDGKLSCQLYQRSADLFLVEIVKLSITLAPRILTFSSSLSIFESALESIVANKITSFPVKLQLSIIVKIAGVGFPNHVGVPNTIVS